MLGVCWRLLRYGAHVWMKPESAVYILGGANQTAARQASPGQARACSESPGLA